MYDVLMNSLSFVADASPAVTAMKDYVAPAVRTLAALAAVVCTFFLVNSGYLYMTSSGKPEQMDHAKTVLRNAIIGLLIVFSATTLVSILSNSYGSPAQGVVGTLPSLQPIPPENVNNGLVDVLIKAVTGLLNNIIQAVATPFLAALVFFTHKTPLMADNPSVFNLWIATVGMADVLFILILTLLGFHVMSATSLGFDELELKQLLPRIGLVFLLMNSSIFFIDAIIGLSNAMITAITTVGGATSVWTTLTAVVKESGGQGVAALLVMLAFLIFSVFLLVYYVLRLITLFIGTVLAPFVLMIWLLPAFRDFSETAIKTFLTTIFVLFVHVVILLLAAALLTGMSATGENSRPDTIMAMVAGLATILALLKTQSVMMQFSYVSMGSRNARKLGTQFMNGVSYMTGKGRQVARKTTAGSSRRGSTPQGNSLSNRRANQIHARPYNQPRRTSQGITVTKRQSPDPSSPKPRRTGETYEAPKVSPLKANGTKGKDNS